MVLFGWDEATTSVDEAREWLGQEGLDGIVAKRLDLPYEAGKRAMQKFKLWKTVDCVVAGLYRNGTSGAVEYLLLGLYDEEGLLHYVGRARVPSDGAEVGRLLEPLVGGTGFTGRAPGGKSRWSGKERDPIPLRARPRRRGQLRPHDQRPHASRREAAALADRQGAGELHDGSSQERNSADVERLKSLRRLGSASIAWRRQ